MNIDDQQAPPCELIIKIGSNESDEISTAIQSVLRKCSINQQNLIYVEPQIQATSYFGSFTPSSRSKSTIQCQSLSCVLLLPTTKHAERADCFKFTELWRFHHKIELLNDNKKIIARQDYYELSQYLPLWSVAKIPCPGPIVVRFNIFTKNFDSMLKFYTSLFQRKPNSSKPGFALFILPSSHHLQYQLSIKYSPSIVPYSISQGAHFKLHLNNLTHFIHLYSSKTFSINSSEYYIYDPDGNLLHLHASKVLPSLATTRKLTTPLNKPFFIHDSGIGDTSDPSHQNLEQAQAINNKTTHPIHVDHDSQSHSSNDSGRWSSVSSNEMNPIRRILNSHLLKKTNIPNNVHHALTDTRSQQRIVAPPVLSSTDQLHQSSLYDSAPHLFDKNTKNNRTYYSINDFRALQSVRPASTYHFGSQKCSQKNPDQYVSFDVDGPPTSSRNFDDHYYPNTKCLNTFLANKRQKPVQPTTAVNVKHLVAQFEQTNQSSNHFRPLSASIIGQNLSKHRSQDRVNRNQNQVVSPSSTRKFSGSKVDRMYVHDRNENASSDDAEDKHNIIDPATSPRINIGITLDSRLRKTPVLDMLRSTTMESITVESPTMKRTSPYRSPSVIAVRF